MSEILFKAKRKDNGEWIEGYPYPSITGELRYMTGYDPCFNNQYMVNSYEIDPETICQYIGLTDKHGVKIFEGDSIRVCLDPEIKVGRVVYDSKIAAFIIAFENNFTTFLDFEIARKKVGEKVWVEVINNTMEENNYEI